MVNEKRKCSYVGDLKLRVCTLQLCLRCALRVCLTIIISFFLFLVRCVGEGPLWPMQSPNKGRKKKEESKKLRGEGDQIKFIDLRFWKGKFLDSGKEEDGKTFHKSYTKKT